MNQVRGDSARKQRPTRRGAADRGAALLIVVAILAILFVLAAPFFSTTRVELNTATNMRNAVQAANIANAGFAMAVSTLQHDALAHSTYTSLDHAWRTYYSGAWVAQKSWMKQAGSAMPRIDGALVDDLGDTVYIPRESTAEPEGEGGTRLRNYLEGLDTFVTPADVDSAGTTYADVVNTFADYDNDGDGLKDSMWIPVPIDRLAEADGIDNDLDSLIVSVNRDPAQDPWIDEPGERIVFLYLGTSDGLDNDADGVIDEQDENRLFWTMDLPSIVFIANVTSALNLNVIDPVVASLPPLVDRLDNDFDFVVNESNEAYIFSPRALIANPSPSPATIQDLNWSTIGTTATFWKLRSTATGAEPRLEDVMVLEEGRAYTNIISPRYTGRPDKVHTAAGEPMCDIAGRVAVLITDASSKVNLNAVNAYSFEERPDDANKPLKRALHFGTTLEEYDLRVMQGANDGLGRTVSARIRALLMGNSRGVSAIPDGIDSTGGAADDGYLTRTQSDFAVDISLPGYGRIDDNGDMLWATMNGIDDDGDGLIDEGLNPVLTAYLGLGMEGIDEPREYQRYRPLRNEVGEGNDWDVSLVNELRNAGLSSVTTDPPHPIGALGDTYLRTVEQVREAKDVGDARMAIVTPLSTVHSEDRNDRVAMRDANNVSRAPGDRPISGLKQDFRFATAEPIIEALRQDWGFAPSKPLDRNNNTVASGDGALFAEGLRSEAHDFELFNLAQPAAALFSDGAFSAAKMPADRELRALQLAVNVQDARDADHARSEVTVTQPDEWWSKVFSDGTKTITYTQAGIEDIRINEIMVRPVRRVEAEATLQARNLGDYTAQFDPNLTPTYPTGHPAGLAPLAGMVLPKFDVQRLYMTDEEATWPAQDISANWTMSATPETYVNGATATPMGPKAVLSTTTVIVSILKEFGNPSADTVTVPNLLEFVFRPTEGLPPGRYYLLVNTTNATGAPTVTAANAGRLKYVIKHVDPAVPVPDPDTVNPPTLGTSIINDFAFWAQDGSGVDPSRSAAYAEPFSGNGTWGAGFVFLPTQVVPGAVDAATEDTSGLYGLGYYEDSAYTVGLREGEELHVAVYLADATGDELAINFFDFSQEPDHEWVEVVNTAKYDPNLGTTPAAQAVDMSGWTLEMNVADGLTSTTPSGITPKRVKMTVPPNTKIAPGGSLLLGFDKFDDAFCFDGGNPPPTVGDPPIPTGLAANTPWPNPYIGIGNDLKTRAYYVSNQTTGLVAVPAQSARTLISANGIGLARDFRLPVLAEVTEPPIPNRWLPVPNGFDGTWVNPDDGITGNADLRKEAALGQSVFTRHLDVTVPEGDFVDRNGDGVADRDDPEAEVQSTSIVAGRDNLTLGLPPEQKPWDRIVQLQWPSDEEVGYPQGGPGGEGEALQKLSNLLLRGGMFPNYPEFDGIDNDDDNAVLSSDRFDNNGNYTVDSSTEGVDEGRHYYEKAGQSEGYPALGFARNVRVPGAPTQSIAALQDNVVYGMATAPDVNATGGVSSTLPDYTYVGNVGSMPEAWRLFVERRAFPGDCVAVTLKDAANRVVDRVTYTQSDVENAAADDKVYFPPSVKDGTGTTRWPENSMALDFYRSLERRHPLYTGDLHGTQNRWQATDGNYDDWAPNMGPGEYVYDPADSSGTALLYSWFDQWLPNAGFVNDSDPVAMRRANAKRYAHALNASPLRANFEERVLDDKEAYTYTFRTDSGGFIWTLGPEVEDGNRYYHGLSYDLPGIEWAPSEARVQNRQIVSMGDVVRMPSFVFRERVGYSNFTANGLLFAGRTETQRLTGALVGQSNFDHVAANQSTLGTEEYPEVIPSDLTVLSSIASFDSKVLSVGQCAVVHPIYPTVSTLNVHTRNLAWHKLSTGSTIEPPGAWAPLFTYSNDAGSPSMAPLFAGKLSYPRKDPETLRQADWFDYRPAASEFPVAQAFMLHPASTALVTDFDRWPLPKRAGYYVSTNVFRDPDGTARTLSLPSNGRYDVTGEDEYTFPPPYDRIDDAHGAVALFVWDGASGLENGEYDLYARVNEPMDLLMAADAKHLETVINSQGLLTPLGRDFVALARGTTESSVLVDLEALTDVDGDGKCWTEPSGLPETREDGLPQEGELNHQEGFGELRGAKPNSEGLVHYGKVRVEHNYLAVMVRNWSTPGQVLRFSGLVLTPNKRTPGRININTMLTTRVKDSTTKYNHPLTGTPGLLGKRPVPPPNPTIPEKKPPWIPPSWETPDTASWRALLEPPAADDDMGATGTVYTAALEMAKGLTTRRGTGWVWNDGRYFTTPTDMLFWKTDGGLNTSGNEVPLNRDWDGTGAGVPYVLAPATKGLGSSTEAKQRQFEEAILRYSALANWLTTRSDVFEVTVTGQSGYLSDPQRPQDYRAEGGFVVTGEHKTRTIYER